MPLGDWADFVLRIPPKNVKLPIHTKPPQSLEARELEPPKGIHVFLIDLAQSLLGAGYELLQWYWVVAARNLAPAHALVLLQADGYSPKGLVRSSIIPPLNAVIVDSK